MPRFRRGREPKGDAGGFLETGDGDSPALAALIDSAATADCRQAGNQAILGATTLALLLRRGLLLVLHGLLLLATVVVGVTAGGRAVSLGRTVWVLFVALRGRGSVTLGRAVGLVMVLDWASDIEAVCGVVTVW